MPLTIETKQNRKISLLCVNGFREQGKFAASVYRKPAFSGVCTNFDSFLPNTYKIGICVNW